MRPPSSFVWLCAALWCGLAEARSSQAATESSPVTRLFRAQLGDTTASMQTALNAESWRWAPAQTAIVTRETEDVSLETTYWLQNGRVSRIYRVVQLKGTDLAPFERAYQLLYQRVEKAAGRTPDQIQALPPWFATLGSSKYTALVDHRLFQSASWNLDATWVSVILRAERGAPVVLLSAEPLTSCSDKSLAAALLELHPPAVPERRAASARIVALCARERGAGALAAALGQEPEPSVRVEVVRSLGRISSPVARTALVDAARADASPDVQKQSLRALVASDAADEAKTIAGDRSQPLALRRLAEAALAEVEKPVPTPAPPVPTRTPAPVAAATAPQPSSGPSVSLPSAPPHPLAEKRGSAAHQVALATSPLPATVPAPVVPAAPVLPPEPEKPAGPADGTAMAIATSAVAGGLWGGSLSLLAQQNNPGVVALLGGAGAVIGGGTAWGITRFGLRPTFSQSFFFANTTAWGSLAGLMAWQATGSDSPKLKYGLLVGGETAGLSLGILGARLWSWTPGQILMADSLLLGAGLAGLGTNRLMNVDMSARVSPIVGYGVAPAMVAAAVAARYLPVTGNDLALMGTGGLWGGWTGSLIASGAAGTSLLGSHQGQGGALLGLGAGYLGMAALSPWVEVRPRTLLGMTGGMAAGNLLGLGVGLLADPNGHHAALGAGVGGVGYAVGALALAPYLRLGPEWSEMMLAGAAYGAGPWALAAAAAGDDTISKTRLLGGALLGGVAGGTVGLLASELFHPTLADYGTVAASTGAGLSMGLGLAKLTTAERGVPDLVGALAGSAVGLAGGTAFAHASALRAPSVAAGALGGGYGLFVGTLAPTLGAPHWSSSRRTSGGSWLGLGLGAVGATALGQWQAVSYQQNLMLMSAGTLGLGMGYGAGLVWSDSNTRPARIGAVAGPAVLAGGALLLDRSLHLSDGLDMNAVPVAGMGAALGMLNGGLLANVVAQGDPQNRQLGGGLLLGASAGLAGGLVLSKFVRPAGQDYFAVGAGNLLGLSLGQGIGRMAVAPDRQQDFLPPLRLAGGLTGAVGAVVATRALDWRWADNLALTYGSAFGGLLGAFVPSLLDPSLMDEWATDKRFLSGGANTGIAVGGLAAAATAHATGASPAQIHFAAAATTLGLGAGLGLGLALPDDSGRPERVGLMAGGLGFAVGAMALDYRLHLSNLDGLNEPVALTLAGGLVGGVEGALLAGALDPHGLVGKTPGGRVGGGILFGTSLGASSGFLLSRFTQPDKAEIMTAMLGGVLGGGLGVGVSMLGTAQAGRSDTLAAMGGSLGALAGTAAFAHGGELRLNAPALFTGLAYGGLIGSLSPALADKRWPGWTRKSTGGLLAGSAGGALTASVIAAAAQPSPAHTGFTAVAGVDGLLGGLGFGLLLDDSSRGARIGTVAGSAAGLVAGAALFPRLQLDQSDAYLIGGLTALGLWNGVWVPALGHADVNEISKRRLWGGALAGGASAALVGTGLASYLTVDTDLMANAALMNVMLAGAGAGAGAMLGPRDDAPVIGMLGGGLAGLALGGALHDHIDISSDDAPWLVLAPLEGLWLGAWLPRVLYRGEDMNQRRQMGGLVAGGLGGAALATLTSRWIKPTGNEAAVVGVSSAIGASLAGGSVLLADDLHDRRGVGILLGGTAVGLGVGTVLAPRLTLDPELGAYMAGGALLGGSEGLVFAWAGRGSSQADYAGAGLLGAGLGATLGMTHAIGTSQAASRKLAAGGFAAWGAWVGAFAGALANRDPHEVTLGGLAGANLGAIAGYGLLSQEWVEPRDFGWLSLFGAAGTLLGGGAGAIFSSKTDPRPVLAGLTIGPALGIAVGAFVLPRLRSLTQSEDGTVSFFDFGRRQVAGLSTTLGGSSSTTLTSADVLATRSGPGFFSRMAHHLGQAFEVTQWSPFVGALPATPGDPSGSSPFIFGVSGTWK